MRLVFANAHYVYQILRIIQEIYGQSNTHTAQTAFEIHDNYIDLSVSHRQTLLHVQFPSTVFKEWDVESIRVALPVTLDYFPTATLLEYLIKMHQAKVPLEGTPLELLFQINPQEHLTFHLYSSQCSSSMWNFVSPFFQCKLVRPMSEKVEENHQQPITVPNKGNKSIIDLMNAQATSSPFSPNDVHRNDQFQVSYWNSQARCSRASKVLSDRNLGLGFGLWNSPTPAVVTIDIQPHEFKRLLCQWIISPPSTTLQWHSDRVLIHSGQFSPHLPAYIQSEWVIGYDTSIFHILDKNFSSISRHPHFPLNPVFSIDLMYPWIFEMYVWMCASPIDQVSSIQWKLFAEEQHSAKIVDDTVSCQMLQMSVEMTAQSASSQVNPQVSEMMWRHNVCNSMD